MYIKIQKTQKKNTIELITNKDLKNKLPEELSDKLLSIAGLKSFVLIDKSIFIKKDDDVEWGMIKPQILSEIVDYFENETENTTKEIEGENTAKTSPAETMTVTNTTNQKNSSIEEVRKVIEQRIRPAIKADGGDIEIKKVENGIVTVKLKGACVGCASSQVTLKSGVERVLKHYFKDIKEVIEE